MLISPEITDNMRLLFWTLIFNAGMYFMVTKQNTKDTTAIKDNLTQMKSKIDTNFKDLDDKIDGLKLDQVQNQAITTVKMDQIQHDISNIRSSEALKNNALENMEKNTLENSFNIKNLKHELNQLKQKVG